MKKSSPDITRGIVNRMKGITRATDKLTKEEANMAEDAWEEVPMMMSQLEFICYAAEEIMDYLDMGIDPEEWYQNKLANAYQTMMSLYSYARGEMRMTSRSGGSGYYDDMYGEEVEIGEELKGGQKNLDHNKNGKIDAQDFHMMRKKKKMSEESNLDESITKMTNGRLKFHMNTGTPHGSYTKDEMKAERDRRLKTDPIAYRSAKASINEVTQTAMKKTVTYIDPKGHSRTRDVPVKRIDKDEHGQDKMRESVEILDEAFKVGIVKLKDGGSVVLKKEDVDLLNKMFNDLSTSNRKKMQEVAMKDKSGFEEILSFAREAI
jgi:site-specific DNA-adenine methylase